MNYVNSVAEKDVNNATECRLYGGNIMEDAIKTESLDELLTFLTRNLSVQEKTEFIEEIQKKTKYIEDDFDQDEVCERFDEWIDSELKHIPITSVEIDCKTDLPIAHT